MSTDKSTTISGITIRQRRQLTQLALDLLGKPSVSALFRYIADYGRIENGKLVVESHDSKKDNSE